MISKLLAVLGLVCFALWIVAKRLLWPDNTSFGLLVCAAFAFYAATRLSSDATRLDTTNRARR